MTSKRKSRKPRILLFVCILFAALALAYALGTDLKGGPDETAHFIYIRSLALHGSLPEIATRTVNTIDSNASHEAHQPPLYYAVMAVPYAVLHCFGASPETIWRILRVLGIVFGVLWVISVYHLSREMLGTERSALAATAFTALIPLAPYMSAVLNNDMMIAALFGWAMVYIVRFAKDGGLERKQAVYLGLLIGAAVLTKSQGLILVPLLLLATLLAISRGSHFAPKAAFRSAALSAAFALIVSGWWLARSVLLHGTIQAQSLSHPFLPHGLADIEGHWPAFFEFTRLICIETYNYFWTPYWLVGPFVNGDVYTWAILLLSALPLAGLLARILFLRDLDMRSLGLLIFAGLVLFATWLHYLLMVDFGAKWQGRLFLPVAPLVGIVAVAGAQRWVRSRSVKRAATIAVYGLLVLANLLVLHFSLAYYALGTGAGL